MKKFIKASKLILIIVLPLLFIKTTHATNCTPTSISPKIGVISKISDHFSLDNVKSFETQDNIVKNNIYSIDEYVNIVQKYINNEALLDLPNTQPQNNNVSISKRAFEKIKVNQGDILIQGPPLHNCKNSFYGFFSSKGVQKYIVIDGNFSDQYSYQGLEISTEPRKDSDCEKPISDNYLPSQNYINSCKSQAILKINNSFSEEFGLSILTTKRLITPRIESITLLDTGYSSSNKLQEDKQQREISYVITFPKSVAKNNCPITKERTKAPIIRENCAYAPVYDKNNNCIIKYKIIECRFRNPKNDFEKFVNNVIDVIADIKSLIF